MILASKLHLFRWLAAQGATSAIAHYYGVPPAQYRRILLGPRPERVLLFGDLDPFDIATWLHLRRLFRGLAEVTYNWALDGDRVIEELGALTLARSSTTMEPAEEAWWSKMRRKVPELDALCSKLGAHKKLEIEAMVTLPDQGILTRHFHRVRE